MANFELFPTPAQAPSAIAPFRWAGISPESTLAMQETLKENHEKYHVFFNDRGFHNHTAHAVLATWALGANGTIIRAAYDHSAVYQRPAYKSPEPITSQNVFDHLGDEKYYDSYLTFFKEELQAKGFSPVLEEYVFSAKANHGSPSKPQMLNRFLAGLIHPLIHTGYGAELGLPGLVAEGLAQTAVHGAEAPSLTPPSMFENLDPTESLTSRLASVLSLNEKSSTKSSKPTGVHALTLVNRVLNDPQFKVAERGPNALESVLEKHSEAIIDLVKDWIVDTSDPQGVEKKIHEIALTNSLLYGVAGWNKDSHFIADFFLMHFVTSSIFLSSLVAYLSPPSQILLLKSYLHVCLAWLMSRGCTSFDVEGFFAADIASPSQPEPQPTPWNGSLAASTPDAKNPNPWLPIIQNSIIYPDEHLPKLQRALAHYSAIYGSRVAGEKDLEGVEMKGADKIDGSVFIRAAGLTDQRMGRVHSGEKPSVEFWDRVL